MPTYQVRRFFLDDSHPEHKLVVATGLTLEEAQAWCQNPATSGTDHAGQVIWFDGYDEES